jgi:hypothetical protein
MTEHREHTVILEPGMFKVPEDGTTPDHVMSVARALHGAGYAVAACGVIGPDHDLSHVLACGLPDQAPVMVQVLGMGQALTKQ